MTKRDFWGLMMLMESITDRQLEYIQRVRHAREAAGKKQEEVADFIGVARNTYTNYELRRTMPQKYIAKFCQFTHVNEKWLLTGSGPMEGESPRSPAMKMLDSIIANLEEAEIATLADIAEALAKQKNKTDK